VLVAIDRREPIMTGRAIGPEIAGTAADLARWLTGRGARRLTSPGGALPDIPAWH
jgi:maleylpyruvate isomerase